MKHPNAKQRLIGYARVSTDEQATGVTTRKCWICPTFENVW